MTKKSEKPGVLEEALEKLGIKFEEWCRRRWEKWSLYTKIFGGVFLLALILSVFFYRIPYNYFALAFITGASFVMFWQHLGEDEFKKKKGKK